MKNNYGNLVRRLHQTSFPGPLVSKRRSGNQSCLQTITLAASCIFFAAGCGQRAIELKNDQTKIVWTQAEAGWKIQNVAVRADGQWRNAGVPSGEYTLLYSKDKPDSTLTVFKASTGNVFPGEEYYYQKKGWEEATHPVTLNKAGEVFHFFPSNASASNGTLEFTYENVLASVSSTWKTDTEFPTDIIVTQRLVAKQPGYYAMATPTLSIIPEEEMAWATVPGYFQSNEMQDDFVLAYAYGHGAPRDPVLYRERSASTLTSIADLKNGVSVSVIAAPGLGRDPWRYDHKTQNDWQIGLSHMNRRGQLAPTLYHPVLGEPQSKMAAGDTIQYAFRFSLRNGQWYESLSHAINDVYHFKAGLALRRNRQSLTDRIRKMHHYLTDTKTSMWNVVEFEGTKIGAQSYLGGVVGSNKDAMKNADYGAMWMLARATGDPFLTKEVLPYALNFKLKQQETDPGFFQGAAIGQYYLSKRKKFVEEWGEFIEPISLTYYTLLDLGNLFLFEPQNEMLRERLRMGADLLLKWQKEDGSWEVAYDHETHEPLFTDIKDLRPTFYGLVVAYRLLHDEKYLEGAVKGARWLITNGVDKGHFIGVCGDARYAPDFATAQTAQALLDLFDITKDDRFKEAAIRTARIYFASIYTHPIPTRDKKIVKGIEKEDWEITQAGLNFEHGGMLGSAQRHGPIQLASHTGLFIRMFQLTGDSLFADMARSAAVGRDAFVDPATSVASYYWDTMNRGAGPYPHHAWWQIGWITDYLMAEAELRSEGTVTFPRGFVTPKVGPHQTYGFAPGKVYGEPANLIIRENLLHIAEPNVEFITAQATSGNRLFIIAMNALGKPLESTATLDISKMKPGAKISNVSIAATDTSLGTEGEWKISMKPYGLEVYVVDYK